MYYREASKGPSERFRSRAIPFLAVQENREKLNRVLPSSVALETEARKKTKRPLKL